MAIKKKISNPEKDKAEVISKIQDVLERVRDLPTLPIVAHEVQRVIHDPKSSMSDLVNVIESDVALSARILRIANSAFYGVPRKVDNLKMALVIIGMDEVNNLVTTVSIMRLFPDGSMNGSFDVSKFWKHSAICAELSVGLYEGLRQPRPSSAYVAGLLHDIGKMLLAKYFNDYFIKCLRLAVKEGLSLAESEVEIIGVDHGHVGSWLTKRWNLPDEINEAIAQHHIRSADSPRFGLATVIDWSDRLYYLMEGHTIEQVIVILQNDPGWKSWKREVGYPTERLIHMLHYRIARSISMISILR